MSDLVYASLVILIIWAGIFFWVLGLDRRLRRLERTLPDRSEQAEEPQAEAATSDPEQGTTTADDQSV